MMDRDMSHQLPNSQVRALLANILKNEKMKIHYFMYEHNVMTQVGFLLGICLPCYETLSDILPETRPMVNGAT